MSALEIRNVRKNYGSVETLKGIDIALQSGEFLVLLGSSGCGKSTLLNIIAGLAEATSGDVLIGGRSILGVHPKNRDIAMVFQSYALYPNLTVRRNIGFGLEMRGVADEEREKAVNEAAKLLQIEALLDRKPSQLSGGQRQRVAIGRALVRKLRGSASDRLSVGSAGVRVEEPQRVLAEGKAGCLTFRDTGRWRQAGRQPLLSDPRGGDQFGAG